MLALMAGIGCGSTPDGKNVKLSHTHYLLGQDLLNRKEPFKAKEELLKALKYNPNNGDSMYLLGVIYFMEAMHDLNLVDREQCLRGEEAREQRAVANEAFLVAQKYFEKVVKLAEKQDKTESNAHVYLANIALHFKRYDEAIRMARKALDNVVFSGRHLAQGVAGWAYFMKGAYPEAGRALRRAVFHLPQFQLGRYRLAKVYMAQKRYERALTELSKVAEDPSHPIQEVPYLAGLAHVKRRELDKAAEQFELCVKKNPKSCLAETCRRMVKDATRNTASGSE